jgi:uncharacterized membrane protein
MNITRAIFDWLHLAAAVIWIGGIHYHVVILAPALRRLEPAARNAFVQKIQASFSRIVWISVVVLVLTGGMKATWGGVWPTMFKTTYGWFFGFKMITVLVMIVVAAVLSFAFGRRLQTLLAASDDEANFAAELEKLQKNSAMMARANLVFGFVLLLLVALLQWAP